MTISEDTIRRIAILIDSLDQAAADALIEQLDDHCAAQVRNTLAKLGHVDPSERQKVIGQFVQEGRTTNCVESEGVEIDISLVERMADTTSLDEPELEAEEPKLNEASGLAIAHKLPNELILQFLKQEHPQAAGIVLKHMHPLRAAELLRKLPPVLQTDLLQRMAHQTHADEDAVQAVADGLQQLAERVALNEQQRFSGVEAIEAILDSTGPTDRGAILSRLKTLDQDLAEQLGHSPDSEGHYSVVYGRFPVRKDTGMPASRNQQSSSLKVVPRRRQKSDAGVQATTEPKAANPMTNRATAQVGKRSLEFADLMNLDDQSLARVFRAADPQTTLLALTGADSDLVERILRRLPFREARMLRRRMEESGPWRLSDLEWAQLRVAELAAWMAEQGDFEIPSPRRFAAAA